MLGPLTYLDVGLIAVAALSGLLAMYRGFTREVLSILSWVAGAGATGYFVYASRPDGSFRQQVELLGKQFGAPAIVVQIAVGAVIFLVVLTIVLFILQRSGMLDLGTGTVAVIDVRCPSRVYVPAV